MKHDHEELEERLAIQADVMDPKAEVHKVVMGPNHQRFLDMLSGKIQLPEPDWVKKRRTS